MVTYAENGHDFTPKEQGLLTLWAIDLEYPVGDDHPRLMTLKEIGITGRIRWLSSPRGWHVRLNFEQDSVDIRLVSGETEWVRRDLIDYKLRLNEGC